MYATTLHLPSDLHVSVVGDLNAMMLNVPVYIRVRWRLGVQTLMYPTKHEPPSPPSPIDYAR